MFLNLQNQMETLTAETKALNDKMQQMMEQLVLAITHQNMANWMIRLADEYLGVMYDYLHTKLYGFHVIQVDKPPCL